jgi:hypothetical protein
MKPKAAVLLQVMLAVAVSTLPAWGHAEATAPSGVKPGEQKLGTVNFPTSCTPAAQQQFERAVAMVHSFFYPDTLKAFQGVVDTDASCAIGYWGIAISQRPNPLVGPFDEATLKRGLETAQKGLAIPPKTEREHDWLAAIEVFYKDYAKIDQDTRALAYEQAMERLVQKYPADSEAAIFYALALNETASHADKTFAKQLKAAAILEKIDREQPDHPGVTHYLIHSYDYTPLADKGLKYANKYAQVAPAAPHAQHMPSHIYSMLGLWEESVKSNQASLAVANETAARLWPGTGKYHQSVGHLWDFMEYAYLQMGQDAQARKVRDDAVAAKEFGVDNLANFTGLAAVEARYVLERGAWKEAMALQPRSSRWPQAEAVTYFARALGAARGGDAAAAQADIGKLKEMRAKLEQAHQDYWAEQTEVQILAASAWLAKLNGNSDEALKLMRAAADLEDSSEKHVAMENRLYPMREILADMLLEMKRPADALKEYDASMLAMPNRLRGFSGAAQAAEQSGDKTKAMAYYRKLNVLTAKADSDRPEIRSARAYVAQQ